MSQPLSPYADMMSLERLTQMYSDGRFLDAKWDVMRQYRVTEASFEDWLIDLVPLKPGVRILDVGAGSGRFAIRLGRRLRDLGGTVVATDLVHDVMTPIREAVDKEQLPVETITADVMGLPANLGTFDIVLAAHMIYHLPDVVAGVRTMRERLAPDGLFVATTNTREGMVEMFGLRQATMELLGIPVETGPPGRFLLENGPSILEEVFGDIRIEMYDGGFRSPSAEPVFRYYAGTELYRTPMRDESTPFDVRLQIASTYVHLAQRVIDESGKPLHVRKEMCALLCR